jgi:hypothetical protein
MIRGEHERYQYTPVLSIQATSSPATSSSSGRQSSTEGDSMSNPMAAPGNGVYTWRVTVFEAASGHVPVPFA